MKEVKLKFNGLGYKDMCQADVVIYDDCNNVVFEGKTYNGYINVCLKKNEVYKVNAYFLGQRIIAAFYVLNDSNYSFSFNSCLNRNNGRTITFLLTDLFYDNMPIEEGNLLLWQR